jgi:hypothetical protein
LLSEACAGNLTEEEFIVLMAETPEIARWVKAAIDKCHSTTDLPLRAGARLLFRCAQDYLAIIEQIRSLLRAEGKVGIG